MEKCQFELALQINTVLQDCYYIKEVVATSKLSNVYIAEATHKPDKYIIKEFYPTEIALRDLDNKKVVSRFPSLKKKFQDLKKIFLNEALIMQQLNHRNIVKYIDHFEENESIYIVMEYYEGQLLNQYLKDIPINERDHLYTNVFIPLIHALTYLHEKGILHRDIKPSNIMIDSNGNPYLLDFGSAIFYKSMGNYQIFTTPGYSPLEQYSNLSKQDVVTDIYSLAATFYYSLTNVVPLDITQRLIEDQIKNVRLYNKKVGILLSQTIMWCLSVQAKRRCSSLKFMEIIISIENIIGRIRNYLKGNNSK